ncbi:hypothetical protein PIB30_108052, partial [Stylosanthes scabra]|nr:hypothetical protein [Stylosanthes scabra]
MGELNFFLGLQIKQGKEGRKLNVMERPTLNLEFCLSLSKKRRENREESEGVRMKMLECMMQRWDTKLGVKTPNLVYENAMERMQNC